MVMGMFSRIREMLEDGDAFVCVLIDEVESLTAARQAAVSGNEPSDAVRVVNALLTQLDQLRRFPNALVLATSNLTNAIDPAFIDRADIKLYVGPPGVAARYDILASCMLELRRAQLVAPFDLFLSWPELQPMLPHRPVDFSLMRSIPRDTSTPRDDVRISMMLHALAKACDARDEHETGELLSGRALRKLPFLAVALFAAQSDAPLAVEDCLDAMHKAIQHEHTTRRELRERSL